MKNKATRNDMRILDTQDWYEFIVAEALLNFKVKDSKTMNYFHTFIALTISALWDIIK